MTGDDIARLVLDVYHTLPNHGKPMSRPDRQEWTVLAGFVIVDCNKGKAECVALGTGLRALPYDKLPVQGDILHDGHAEVIARRAFKLWLLRKARSLGAGASTDSRFCAHDGLITLAKGVTVALYVSTLPCASYFRSLSPRARASDSESDAKGGDASTSALALASKGSLAEPTVTVTNESSADSETRTVGPFTLHASRDTAAHKQTVYRGRMAYSALSTLRTKPGRRDSPPTTSHSCSDKIASWSFLGLQGALLSHAFDRVPLSMLVIGGVARAERAAIETDVGRAIWLRMQPLILPHDAPRIVFTDVPFEYDRTPDKVSAVMVTSWCEGVGAEVCGPHLIKNGFALKRDGARALSAKQRSQLSKLSLFEQAALVTQVDTITYYDFKQSATRYQAQKAKLRSGPFAGWLVKGASFESFSLSDPHTTQVTEAAGRKM